VSAGDLFIASYASLASCEVMRNCTLEVTQGVTSKQEGRSYHWYETCGARFPTHERFGSGFGTIHGGPNWYESGSGDTEGTAYAKYPFGNTVPRGWTSLGASTDSCMRMLLPREDMTPGHFLSYNIQYIGFYEINPRTIPGAGSLRLWQADIRSEDEWLAYLGEVPPPSPPPPAAPPTDTTGPIALSVLALIAVCGVPWCGYYCAVTGKLGKLKLP
jgi:hypothetical protein